MKNKTLYEAFEFKLHLWENRLANAQYNVGLYREALEMAAKKTNMVPTKRKIEQLEMFTA